MKQTAIPYIFMRGGTSRGPYFRRADLPEDLDELAQVLISAMGSGHALNIDGIGGGAAVATKVVMLSEGTDRWADVDYFFAQVSVEEQLVDFKPTCGNMLSGVGPAAIEMGIVNARDGETEVKIHAVNVGARIVANVKTDVDGVVYSGDVAIDGVPGTAAPIELNFMNVVGSATGSLLPTGNMVDHIQGVDVTCIDVAMPMVIAQAESMGLTGYETRDELDANQEFLDRMEKLRIEAGERMGIENVAKSVTPKFGVFAPARNGGTIAVRYFMPWQTHPTMAVTGAQCMASCALMPGTVADGMLSRPDGSPAMITLEHPSGTIDILVDYRVTNSGLDFNSAGLIALRASWLMAKCIYRQPYGRGLRFDRSNEMRRQVEQK